MPGIVVYDVGQNLTGWVEVEVEAPAGTPIEIFYSEKLASDGTATTDGNALVYGQLQTDYYVARGGVRRPGGRASRTRAFSTCSSARRVISRCPRASRRP